MATTKPTNTAEALNLVARRIRECPSDWQPHGEGACDLYGLLHAVAPGAMTTKAFAAIRATVFGSQDPAPLGTHLAKLNAEQTADLCTVAARYADAWNM